MNKATPIINFLKITKKKVIITLLIFLAASLIFLLSEYWFSKSGIYPQASVYYGVSVVLQRVLLFFIGLPIGLALVITDMTGISAYSHAFQVLIYTSYVLTLIWWYILSCILVFLLKKRRKR